MQKDTTMAVSSVAALMRHQNQRSRKRRPVPAPICRMMLKTCSAFSRMSASAQETTMSTTVDRRPTQTSCFSEASGLMKRSYTSFTMIDEPQFTWVDIVDMYAAAREVTTNPSRPGGSIVSMAGYAMSFCTTRAGMCGN